jgi:predicted short-subunit dehydrogenase-like oxidoreductase (DUF2520 family)
VNQPEIKKVVLIGAGKLAWHLGIALMENNIQVHQVFNRTKARGEQLALLLNAEYIDDLSKLNLKADLYILAVSDQAILQMANGLVLGKQMIVHTSGAVEMDIFRKRFSNFGVFYPLQTFSFTQKVNFSEVPVCLEANSAEGLEKLTSLAANLRTRTYNVNSTQRRHLHLAAVFACNFSNFMYVIASDILKQSHLSPELIEPLIHQTNQLPAGFDFFAKQTGPAVRGDDTVLQKHRQMLTENVDFLEIYNIISRQIAQYQSKHGQL